MHNIHDAVRHETEALHKFISAWFRGEERNLHEVFRAGLSNRLDPGFVNIQPAGRVLVRDALLRSIESGYGTNPDFEIFIEDSSVRRVFDRERYVLATYTEIQEGAKNSTPSRNARLSTVLFKWKKPNGPFSWLHLHESKLPTP